MKITQKHPHCTIPQYELNSVLNLAFPIMKEDILNCRYFDLCALPDDAPHYELMKQNLKFLNRLGLAVIKMYRHPEVYETFNYFVSLYIERNFNERKSYYWYELKSILFMAIYFKEVTKFSEFKSRMLNNTFHFCLAKYKRTDAVDKKSVSKATAYYNKIRLEQASLQLQLNLDLDFM